MTSVHENYVIQNDTDMEDKVKRMMIGITNDVRRHLYETQTLPSVHFSPYEWEMVLKYWPSVYMIGNHDFIQKQKRSWLDFVLGRKKSPIKFRIKLADGEVERIQDEWRNTNIVLIDGYSIKVNIRKDGCESRI